MYISSSTATTHQFRHDETAVGRNGDDADAEGTTRRGSDDTRDTLQPRHASRAAMRRRSCGSAMTWPAGVAACPFFNGSRIMSSRQNGEQ
jgi:hypothetical protein